jgi:crossover junction endodeoxyribonuclease RusA
MISFTVPGKPVPKGRARVTRTGHAYTPKRTKEYEELIGQCFIEAYRGPRPAFPEGNVTLVVKVYESGKRYADADNYLKACSDGINGLGYTDDVQVTTALVTVERESSEPRIEIRLYAL